MRVPRLHLLALPLLVACFEKGSDDDDDDDDDGGDDSAAVDEADVDTDSDTDADTDTDTDTDADTDTDTDSDTDTDAGCPDAVPEAYRDEWDCEATTCDGPMLYQYGVGTSTAGGDLALTEQWFVFSGPGDWCADAFTITGESTPIDPATFNCAECEEAYAVTWEHSGTDCGVSWSGVLFGSSGSGASAPYDGFITFDTHTAFGDRNADNGLRVTIAPVLDSTAYSDVGYATGTATPSSAADGPPQDYVYAGRGTCLGE